MMAFDCVILMTQASLGKDEVKYACLCAKYGQPVVFVRSKCDVDLRNLRQDGMIRTQTNSTAAAKSLVEKRELSKGKKRSRQKNELRS